VLVFNSIQYFGDQSKSRVMGRGRPGSVKTLKDKLETGRFGQHSRGAIFYRPRPLPARPHSLPADNHTKIVDVLKFDPVRCSKTLVCEQCAAIPSFHSFPPDAVRMHPHTSCGFVKAQDSRPSVFFPPVPTALLPFRRRLEGIHRRERSVSTLGRLPLGAALHRRTITLHFRDGTASF
jgi:hypothetical protein